MSLEERKNQLLKELAEVEFQQNKGEISKLAGKFYINHQKNKITRFYWVNPEKDILKKETIFFLTNVRYGIEVTQVSIKDLTDCHREMDMDEWEEKSNEIYQKIRMLG